MTHNPTRSASEGAFSLSLLPYAQLSGDTVLAAPVSSVTFDLSALQSSWGFSEGAWHKATCPWRRLLPSSSTRGIEVVRVFALASRPAMGFTYAHVSAEEVAFLRASSTIATVPGLVVVLLILLLLLLLSVVVLRSLGSVPAVFGWDSDFPQL